MEWDWQPWHPDEVADRLSAVRSPWYIAAGWALDLWHGRPTREHHDVEIGIPRAAFGEFRDALAGYEFEVAHDGRLWPLDSPAFEQSHQTWVRDPATGAYRLDIFREPHDGYTWISRRDPALQLPYDAIIRRTDQGVPYLAPELVLLFKAKAPRPKDRTDLDNALPRLPDERRDWLCGALTRIDPAHPWLDVIRPSA